MKCCETTNTPQLHRAFELLLPNVWLQSICFKLWWSLLRMIFDYKIYLDFPTCLTSSFLITLPASHSFLPRFSWALPDSHLLFVLKTKGCKHSLVMVTKLSVAFRLECQFGWVQSSRLTITPLSSVFCGFVTKVLPFFVDNLTSPFFGCFYYFPCLCQSITSYSELIFILASSRPQCYTQHLKIDAFMNSVKSSISISWNTVSPFPLCFSFEISFQIYAEHHIRAFLLFCTTFLSFYNGVCAIYYPSSFSFYLLHFSFLEDLFGSISNPQLLFSLYL